MPEHELTIETDGDGWLLGLCLCGWQSNTATQEADLILLEFGEHLVEI